MPRNKKGSKKKGHLINLTDITLNDYANSSVAKDRFRKSTNSLSTVIKQEEKQIIAPESWDDEEFETDYDYIKTTSESGSVSFVLKKIKNVVENDLDTDETEGNNYPFDVWVLISEFIRPEEIGTFSGICKTSYNVTKTFKFWTDIYKRYYKQQPDLPRQLKPDHTYRLYGLRTLVIRALFHFYPPFVNRLVSEKTEEHPEALRRLQCILMWHQKCKSKWLYYFKFKESSSAQREIAMRKPDLLEMLDNIAANSEENCRILQVTCKNFIPVEPIQGLFLKTVSITLSHDLRDKKVLMNFDSGLIYVYNGHESKVNTGSSVLLDPVTSVKVLDWWHPLYPHSYNVDILRNHEESF